MNYTEAVIVLSGGIAAITAKSIDRVTEEYSKRAWISIKTR